MAKHDLISPSPEELAHWPRPDAAVMPQAIREAYEARCAALSAVAYGTKIKAAAKQYKVNRNTLSSVCYSANQIHPDGEVWGFRACVPHRRKAVVTSKHTGVPLASAPHAFSRLLRALPALATLISLFKGALPTRTKRSGGFERLVAEFVKFLRKEKLEHCYPLNTPDKGRRALQSYIQRVRRELQGVKSKLGEQETDSVTRLDQIFSPKPYDRLEFDAHRIDVDFHARVPLPGGGTVLRKIPVIWLLAIIDVGSRSIVAWTIVIGRGYKKFDVLRLIAKSMTPWQRRHLIVPNMTYVPDAWMPGLVEDGQRVPRAFSIAYDNAKAHWAKLAQANLEDFHLGVLNAGSAGIPEQRAYIEAFFRIAEEKMLRLLAGGYEPATQRGDEPTKISTLKPSEYPVDFAALEDLMDVLVSSYNVTQHGGLFGRTPRDAFEQHVQSGAWMWHSSLTNEDTLRLEELRINVRFRGSQKTKKQPHINWEGARYRASVVFDRWDLINKSFAATVQSGDIRRMRLWDRATGELYVTLGALPPWDACAHSLELRQQAIHWRNRGMLSLPGSDDAVAAYHAYVRAESSKIVEASEVFVKSRASAAPASPQSHHASPPVPVPIPRGGWISLGDGTTGS